MLTLFLYILEKLELDNLSLALLVFFGFAIIILWSVLIAKYVHKKAYEKHWNHPFWHAMVAFFFCLLGFAGLPSFWLVDAYTKTKPPQKWLCKHCNSSNESTTSVCSSCGKSRFFSNNTTEDKK